MTLILKKPFDKWGERAFEEVRSLQGTVARSLERRKTLRFEWEGGAYYAKYHKGGSVGELVKNLLSLRMPVFSAKNEWDAIEHLHRHGVDTMTAVAYGYRGVAPLWTESFLITKELKNCISLEEVFLKGVWETLTVAERRDLVRLLAETVKKMHEAGVNHRDCYLCHFLWNREENRLYIIDLHRSQIRTRVPHRWLLKDIASLYFSSISQDIPSTYIMRFAKVYGQDKLKDLLPSISKKVEKIQRHNQSLKEKRGFL